MPTTRTDRPQPFWRRRWYMPAFCLFLGALMFAALTIGGDLGSGLTSLAIMAALGAVFLFGGRSETLSGLGGPGRDERWAMIDLRDDGLAPASCWSVVIIGAFCVEVTRGEDGSPWSLLGAVGGVAYVVFVRSCASGRELRAQRREVLGDLALR